MILFLFFALLQSCSIAAESDCKNQLLATLKRVDHKQRLVLFTRDCGATTTTSIQVSILNHDVSVESIQGGNLFIADGKSTPESYKEAVLARWLSQKAIEIQFDKKLRVFRQDSVMGNIRIKYLSK